MVRNEFLRYDDVQLQVYPYTFEKVGDYWLWTIASGAKSIDISGLFENFYNCIENGEPTRILSYDKIIKANIGHYKELVEYLDSITDKDNYNKFMIFCEIADRYSEARKHSEINMKEWLTSNYKEFNDDYIRILIDYKQDEMAKTVIRECFRKKMLYQQLIYAKSFLDISNKSIPDYVKYCVDKMIGDFEDFKKDKKHILESKSRKDLAHKIRVVDIIHICDKYNNYNK